MGVGRWQVMGLALFLFISLLPGETWSAHRASTSMQLVAMVAPKVKFQVTKETTQIAATAEDLDRGYIDLPMAAEILMWTNSKNGLSIIARADGDLRGNEGGSIPLSALSISLNGSSFRSLTSTDQILWVGSGQEVRSPKRIDYHLQLDREIKPDIYTVNLAFMVMGN